MRFAGSITFNAAQLSISQQLLAYLRPPVGNTGAARDPISRKCARLLLFHAALTKEIGLTFVPAAMELLGLSAGK